MHTIECIAHRGFWNDDSPKNSASSFEQAFRSGFGVETDLRDHLGQVVISHDPPGSERPPELTFAELLELYKKLGGQGTLALNIKADGLAMDIKKTLEDHEISQYFVFDMSIPDMLSYTRLGMNVFARQSELETPLIFQDGNAYGATATKGIWLDAFYSVWYPPKLVTGHLAAGFDVCMVSPELHRRDHLKWWREIKKTMSQVDVNAHQRIGKLMLCTDYPEKFATQL